MPQAIPAKFMYLLKRWDQCQPHPAGDSEGSNQRLVPIQFHQPSGSGVHHAVFHQRRAAVEQLDRARRADGNFARPVPVHRPAGHQRPTPVLPRPFALTRNLLHAAPGPQHHDFDCYGVFADVSASAPALSIGLASGSNPRGGSRHESGIPTRLACARGCGPWRACSTNNPAAKRVANKSGPDFERRAGPQPGAVIRRFGRRPHNRWPQRATDHPRRLRGDAALCPQSSGALENHPLGQQSPTDNQ